MIKHVENEKEFEELTNGKTVLVDFFATWCGPCKMLSPVLEQVDKENLIGMDIIKIDVDEVLEVASKYNVQAIPTLIVFKEGKPVNTIQGYQNKDNLVEWVKKSVA